MRPRRLIRLLVGPLVLMLAGANSGAPSMCAACCMPAEAARHAAAQPYHRMESQSNILNASAGVSHDIQRQHHCGDFRGGDFRDGDSKGGDFRDGAFPLCPSRFGARLNHGADCAGPAVIEMLKEGSFSFDAPRENAPADLDSKPAWAFGVTGGTGFFPRLSAFPTIRIFDPAVTRLRI
jgi:hypothetical protein